MDGVSNFKGVNMSNKLESYLRDSCNLIDWVPTRQQLTDIENDINDSIKSGKVLSKSDCRNIVVKHCGSTKMFVTKGVDNSDLNTLLSLAISQLDEED